MIFAALAGCSPRNYIGEWKGYRNLADSKGNVDPVLRTISEVDLVIKPNGKFDLFEGGYPKSGSVRYESGKGFLKVETMFGRPVSSMGDGTAKMNSELSIDAIDSNRIRFLDPQGFDKGPLILNKVVQPSGPNSRTNNK